MTFGTTLELLNSSNSGAKDHALELLVHELLLVRTEPLEAAQIAAFMDGWSSLLDLIRRTDLLFPNASEDQVEWIAMIVERIRSAQAAVLDDGTG